MCIIYVLPKQSAKMKRKKKELSDAESTKNLRFRCIISEKIFVKAGAYTKYDTCIILVNIKGMIKFMSNDFEYFLLYSGHIDK